MKLKKVLALSMAAVLTLSMAACGSGSGESAAVNTNEEVTEEAPAETTEETGEDAAAEDTASAGELSYTNIVLGESYKDITTTIKWLTHRTDLIDSGMIDSYIAKFNETYPDITVEVEGVTNYADDALLRLTAGNWGDIIMIPAVDKNLLSEYFVPYGSLDDVSEVVRFADQWMYDNTVYGIASTGNAQGIVYNKAVFEQAGITAIPKTPEEFIAALQAVKDNTDAIPLYTNYAAGWTMGAWDAYINGSATGSSKYMNQELIHTQDPFQNYGDDTHAYAVYKILYDATANGLIEDDYTTTDWEGCKGMINNGEIGCMVLGSWAYSQMVDAGEHGDDIGYMSFPITVGGKQYASAGPDYNYGINVNASDDNKAAAMVFVKWMTEESGFAYNEGGVPISMDGEYPALYSAFDGIEFIADEPAVAGEEDILNELNAESELNINSGGDSKIQAIIEHAANGDMTFDEIMAQWNEAWTSAQETVGVEVTN
ncbi:ABC transporter substrate-binding protein [Kineothrix sedimenti]|uniref:ABC transporter substrate-binding protein n=1 Tax=Kineothrix sedimenti TaxID=3123317 RepID=A0ABZ3EVT7_9FIRM